MQYYLDRAGRPKTLDTHQFIPKTTDLAGWTQVDRPLTRAELLAQLAGGDTAAAAEPHVIDFSVPAVPLLTDGEDDDEDDEDDDDDTDPPAAEAPPSPADPPSGPPPGNAAETPPGDAETAEPKVVEFSETPAAGGPAAPPASPQHPSGWGPANRCGNPNCTGCIYKRDLCTISGAPIRPPPPLAAVRTDVASFFGIAAGATSLVLTKFFDVPLVEAMKTLMPSQEEIDAVAVHAQIVEHRYGGGALAEHAELRAMVGAAGAYFTRLGYEAQQLVKKWEERGAGEQLDTPASNGRDPDPAPAPAPSEPAPATH